MAKNTSTQNTTEWNYAASPESTSHIRLEKKYQLFINNEWVYPSSKKYFPSTNPATEEVLAE
ncbi:MAG: betaine-aldehyde dehydrogenase, partial [Bacteroidota bacterium]